MNTNTKGVLQAGFRPISQARLLNGFRFLLVLLFMSCWDKGLFCGDRLALIPQNELKSQIAQRVDTARKRIWVAHYIIYNDAGGREFIANLMKKALQGLDVRVVMDGIGAGARFPWSSKELKTMAAAGVKVQIFHPKFRSLINLNKRMHGKIILLDDEAVIGSSSLWDMSFKQYLSETDVLLQGDIVSRIGEHFLEIWDSPKSQKPFSLIPFRIPDTSRDSFIERNISLFGSIYPTNPPKWNEYGSIEYVRDEVIKNPRSGSFKTILSLLGEAKSSLDIVNPYFFPVEELKATLDRLVAANVKVRIFTNSAQSLSQEFNILGVKYLKLHSYFKNSGLEIWELRNFDSLLQVHDKLIIVDKATIFIGSFNFDRLGAFYNTENGIILRSNELSSIKGQEDILHWLDQKISFIRSQSHRAFPQSESDSPPGNGCRWYQNLPSYILIPFIGRCF